MVPLCLAYFKIFPKSQSFLCEGLPLIRDGTGFSSHCGFRGPMRPGAEADPSCVPKPGGSPPWVMPTVGALASIEALVLLLLWVQPWRHHPSGQSEGLVDRWVPGGRGRGCSHVVVRGHTAVMTSHVPKCRDPFRDPWTYLARHHVSRPKTWSIFHNKQEISFTCTKKKKWT